MSLELDRYYSLMTEHCYPSRSNCPGDRKKACRSLKNLVARLEQGKATGKAKDAVRESMRRLDRCRVKSGERLSLYGLKRRGR